MDAMLQYLHPRFSKRWETDDSSTSPARRVARDDLRVTLADVGGLAPQKDALRGVVEFLRNPSKFRALGAYIPRNTLLCGPSGCGKTLLARAAAGEARVPVFHASGAGFVTPGPGAGAARVRNMFRSAWPHKPCLIIIDDIDAFARTRGAGGGTRQELEPHQALVQFMNELEWGFANVGVLVLATTSRLDLIDPALLQPARCSQIVPVHYPNPEERREILSIHLRCVPREEQFALEPVVERTDGLSGAAIASLVNRAALLAAKTGKKKVDIADLQAATEQELEHWRCGNPVSSRLMGTGAG